VVPGGRVELPTPAFSGPRSTGELPRQFGRKKIVRARSNRSKGLAKLFAEKNSRGEKLF
jgi:hypothetical protein